MLCECVANMIDVSEFHATTSVGLEKCEGFIEFIKTNIFSHEHCVEHWRSLTSQQFISFQKENFPVMISTSNGQNCVRDLGIVFVCCLPRQKLPL